MCLGVPGKIMAVDGQCATVDFWGVKRQILLTVVDQEVKAGDYVLVHVGFAIKKIPQSEIAETLSFYDGLLKQGDRDLMASDVADEMKASS